MPKPPPKRCWKNPPRRIATRTTTGRPVDRTLLMQWLFLASAWTLFGVVVLADATRPYTTADRIMAVLTIPGPFITLALLLAFCVQPVWGGKKEDERMRRGSVLALSGALALTPVCPGHPAPPYPTPEIREIAALDIKGMVAYAMRGELGNSGAYVGLAVRCARRGPADIEATAFFGAFPGAHHPVQLAVRRPDGTGERFGAVLAGGPEAGFHSPQLRDPHDVERFVTVALQPGALISNGYRSFWNRTSAQRNQQVREEFLACVHRPRD